MDIVGLIKVFLVVIFYSALSSYLFPIKYDFIRKYTKRGGIMDTDLDFVNTFLIHSVSLLVFLIIYGLILKRFIFDGVY